MAGGAQQPDEGIAENGIAQMPDVRRLVGIDAGVFDQNLAADVGRAFAIVARDFRLRVAAGQRLRSVIALQARVDIAGARHFKPLEAIRQRHFRRNLFGDLARRLAQTLGQLERQRERELAHLHRWRLVDDDIGHLDLILLAQKGAHGVWRVVFDVRGTRIRFSPSLSLFALTLSLEVFSVSSVPLW